MICPKCGANLSGQPKFCPKCGTKLESASARTEQQSFQKKAAVRQQEEITEQRPKKRGTSPGAAGSYVDFAAGSCRRRRFYNLSLFNRRRAERAVLPMKTILKKRTRMKRIMRMNQRRSPQKKRPRHPVREKRNRRMRVQFGKCSRKNPPRVRQPQRQKRRVFLLKPRRLGETTLPEPRRPGETTLPELRRPGGTILLELLQLGNESFCKQRSSAQGKRRIHPSGQQFPPIDGERIFWV